MVKKQFFNKLSNSKTDIIQLLFNLLDEHKIDYCVIGGLAVNAYVEPVVSLDLDIVLIAEQLPCFREAAQNEFRIRDFAHSINLDREDSDLRIQIQADRRYQEFIKRAMTKNILGYEMRVAALEDVLQGKIWAYSDETRRQSKRQKDLADIYRIVENYPQFLSMIPEALRP